MTPGSILLGNASHCFECVHEQATGDPLCRLQLRAGILRSHRRRRGRIGFRATIRNAAAAAASARVGAPRGARHCRVARRRGGLVEEIALTRAACVARLASDRQRAPSVAPVVGGRAEHGPRSSVMLTARRPSLLAFGTRSGLRARWRLRVQRRSGEAERVAATRSRSG
jgi:hypothetical protein